MRFIATLVLIVVLATIYVLRGQQILLSGPVGGDYTFFLPRLLYGYLWQIENGFLSIPWFSPAWCGGLPFYADPQVMYHSIPQLLTWFVDPVRAVYFTYLFFGAVGALGTYLLLGLTFRVNHWLALAGSALFAFNEFYLFRMMFGHLTNHAYMLIPLLAWLLAGTANGPNTKRLGRTLVTGLVMGYFIQGGAGNLLLPAILATGLLLSLKSLEEPSRFGAYLGCGAAAVGVAVLVSLAKVTSAYAFISHFPRETLALGVFDGFQDALLSTLTLLFLNPWMSLDQVVSGYVIQEHELRFGVTIAPAIMLIIGTAAMPRLISQLTPARSLILLLIMVMLLIPVVISIKSGNIDSFLKTLPYFREMSVAVRWVSLLIPVAIVAPILLFQQVLNGIDDDYRRGQLTTVAFLGSMVILAVSIYMTVRPSDVLYDPGRIVEKYRVVKAGGAVPTIAAITEQPGSRTFSGVDDDFLAGGSSHVCYQPIFGYKLEKYPIRDLRPGSIFAERAGHLNLKNPACYVYPEANHCRPGQHFTVNEKEAASRFATNQSFEWQKPWYHQASLLLNMIALLVVLLILPFSFLRRR